MESFSLALSSARCSSVRGWLESPAAELEIRRYLPASSEGQELIEPSRVLSDGFLTEFPSVARLPSNVSDLRVASNVNFSDFLLVDLLERKVSFSF